MKTVYISVVAAVLIIGGVLVWRNTGNKTDSNPEATASPSVSPTPTLTASPQATAAHTTPTTKPLKRTPTPTPKPTPGIIINEEVSYEAWIKWLDPLNRWLALDKDCTSIVPSQVDYPNNVEVMLDNSASAKARILKIGDREYSLGAHSWIITTLHSETLPKKLPIFCGQMELGQLDLVK